MSNSRSSMSCAISGLSTSAARLIGVLPSVSAWCRSPPLSSRNITQLAWPERIAMCNGVAPPSSGSAQVALPLCA